MRHLTTLILTIFWVLNSNAQEFGTHWISYPLPNDSAEVWFRKNYIMHQRPIQAFLSIASTGSYKLYVNERNVTGSTKFDGMKDSILLNRTFDITRYLKKGENIIAVWYAPAGKPSHGKQLSAEFYGWSQDSLPFHHQTDGTWLTHQLMDCNNSETAEQYDGRTNHLSWKSDGYRLYKWFHPTGSTAIDKTLKSQDYRVLKAENKLYNTLSPVKEYSDSLGYHIDFGRPFHGTIRLTLRDAHKGDKLYINGYQYICNGELDEQAFFRFKYQNERIYTLIWSDRFKKNYIVNVEGLEMAE